MASCTSTFPNTTARAWTVSKKRPRNCEVNLENPLLDSRKSRKTSIAKEKSCHKKQTHLPQRPLSDITRQVPSELDVNTSAETRDIVAVSEKPNSPAGDETVTYVNNLFSPVNKLQAIPLTLDELRRRTDYPEYFGRSEMVAYLRHSKTTGNDLISRYNLKPKSKRSRVNVLSRLCEKEARILANGIHQVNSEYFPTDYVAETMKEHMERDRVLNQEAKPDEGEGTDRSGDKETINTTIGMLQSLRESLENPDEELGKDLEVFERATHTFGCQNIMNHISFVESYLAQLQKKL